MARVTLIFIVFLTCLSTGYSQEDEDQKSFSRKEENAFCSDRDTTVLSMMGWGVILGVGIAVLCGLMASPSPPDTSN